MLMSTKAATCEHNIAGDEKISLHEAIYPAHSEATGADMPPVTGLVDSAARTTQPNNPPTVGISSNNRCQLPKAALLEEIRQGKLLKRASGRCTGKVPFEFVVGRVLPEKTISKEVPPVPPRGAGYQRMAESIKERQEKLERLLGPAFRRGS